MSKESMVVYPPSIRRQAISSIDLTQPVIFPEDDASGHRILEALNVLADWAKTAVIAIKFSEDMEPITVTVGKQNSAESLAFFTYKLLERERLIQDGQFRHPLR